MREGKKENAKERKMLMKKRRENKKKEKKMEKEKVLGIRGAAREEKMRL